MGGRKGVVDTEMAAGVPFYRLFWVRIDFCDAKEVFSEVKIKVW